jgi:CheY-like chemotaxis protein
VVIADLQMPLRDGAEIARAVRAEMGTGSRPYLITLTAAVTLEDRQRCLDAGMDDFLTKPLRMSTLRDALQRADAWLSRHRQGYGAP